LGELNDINKQERGLIWIDDQVRIGENSMIQITKVLNGENGKIEDPGTTAENRFTMAFEKNLVELDCFYRP